MQKNQTNKWAVFAFQDEGGTNPGEPVTGDAANITADVHIDAGAANAVDDTNPTELGGGYYVFDITAAESNGDLIVIVPASGTANVNVIGVPGAVWTTPANFPALGIESDGDITKVNTLDGHTAQTGDTFGALPTNFSSMGIEADGHVHGDLKEWKGSAPANLVDTDKVSTVPSSLGTQAKADVNAEADTALTDYDAVVPADLPTNFADLAITASTGKVTVGTNDDKTGYSISGAITTLDGLENISTAEVNAEVDTALTDIGLDHLVSGSVAGTDVADDSIFAKLVSASVTADWDDFDNTTDSLQATRDHIGDGSNLTEAGGDGDHLTAVPWNSSWDAEVQSEVADALDTAIPGSPTANSINERIAAIDDKLPSGTISDFDESSDTVTVGTNNDKTGYQISGTINTLDGLNDPTAATVAAAVWDEARAGHASAGSFGEGVASVQGDVTGNVDGSVGSISGVTFPTNFADLAITVTAGEITVGTNNDKTGYEISGAKTTLDDLNDISTSQVNTEVDNALDTAIPGSPTANSINQRIKALDELAESGGSGDLAAIKTETDKLDSPQSEPTGVPAANESPLGKVAYQFKALRNQVDATSSKKKFYDDDGTVGWEKDVTDDGTTYSETKANAP